jgi:hypothetical protein
VLQYRPRGFSEIVVSIVKCDQHGAWRQRRSRRNRVQFHLFCREIF